MVLSPNMYFHVKYRFSPSFLQYEEIETYIANATRRKLLIIDIIDRNYVIGNTWRRYCSNYIAHCTTNICRSLWIQKHGPTTPAHQLTLHSCNASEHFTLISVELKADSNICIIFFLGNIKMQRQKRCSKPENSNSMEYITHIVDLEDNHGQGQQYQDIR